MNIWVAFLTGLTTGGLSCMAVQGGLLAGSLANQIETDLQNKTRKEFQFRLALPIALFLAAKLAVYTLAGFFLGMLGSVFEITAVTRALMQIGIGVFIIGNALRMFNVHPIFRYFSFEPPTWLTRYIRRTSKSRNSWVTPLYLGALTIFIPCGVTQGVMAAAMATANPWQGAALLFAFTLGTSPVFFLLSYLATKLSSTMETYFMRIVAAVLLVLGILAVDSGLNLLGSPYSITRLAQSVSAPASETASSTTGRTSGELTLAVKGSGYEPRTLRAPADTPIKLNLVTKDTYSCSRAFTIPELNLTKILPKTGTVVVDIPAQQAGKVMVFSCSMGMYTGEIIFGG